MKSTYSRDRKKLTIQVLVAIVLMFFYNEYLVYYITQIQCSWPQLQKETEEVNVKFTSEEPIRAVIIADTHLLGYRKGHWFDKLRREWQMYRAFQTAMHLQQPDLVFVLGDLLDEGLWSGSEDFKYHTQRFYKLFAVPEGTEMYIAAGNHDMGFHYGISPYLNNRFVTGFNAPTVQLTSTRGNHFILINSMALEGDGCFLCKPAEMQIKKLQRLLNCTKYPDSPRCSKEQKLRNYSRPILLQHFPLYRRSDVECFGEDSAPMEIKQETFREKWECLSKESTLAILKQLNPRLVLSGHTHHGCARKLPIGDGLEITVPSFSWRNKDNPNYGMAIFTSNNYAFSKCRIPRESTVICLYITWLALILFWIIYSAQKMRRVKKYS